MRRILSILFSFISISAVAQFPNTINTQNANTNLVNLGAGTFSKGVVIGNFSDTTSANAATWIKGVPYIVISTNGALLWQRNAAATQWVQISGGGGTPSCGSLIGGLVSWDTLLIFQISAASQYCISGTNYSSAGGSITLDPSDPSLARIDVIGLNSAGNVFKLTGVPSANPIPPQIDPSSQYYLTFVLVNAGAVAPTGVYSSILYDEENVGEWVGSATGLTANFGYTANPSNVYHLTKSTDVGAFTNADVIDYTGVTYPLNQYNLLRFFVKLKSTIDPTANISVTLLSNGLPCTVPLQLTSANGFTKSNTTSFQNITIPFADLNFTSDPPTINGIRFTMNGSNPNGYYLDYITIQGGINNTTNENFLTDVFQNTTLDTLYKVKNGVPTAFAVIPSADTTITKFPMHTITGGTYDSLAVYGVDSSFQLFSRVGDSLRLKRFNGDSSSVYAPISAGGTVTSFGKIDNYGITSSVSNPTTTPVHTVGVDTTVIGSHLYIQNYLATKGPNKYVTKGNYIIIDSSVANVYNISVDSANILLTTSGIPSATFPTNKGFMIRNATAATSTFSPVVDFLQAMGFGWATNSGGSSQPLRWLGRLSSTNSTVNPLSQISFMSSINGATPVQRFAINDLGTTIIGDGVNAGSGSISVNGNGTFSNTTLANVLISSSPTNSNARTAYANGGANYWGIGSNNTLWYVDNLNRGTRLLSSPDVAGTPRLGINTSSPAASSVLDVTATDKGMLIPRMTTSQKNGISTPATGLLVYDTDLKDFYYYENSSWNPMGGSFAINSTTTGLSSATLNSTYPNVPIGYRVICGSITLGGAIYVKYTEAGSSDVWLIISSPVVP